ncbi:protein FAM50A-like [Halichondria panicea]|uniref:protein FAM50A-like n=1 Tax=Halichondria panicea TaxID=6063 RepID=UPI00312B570A
MAQYKGAASEGNRAANLLKQRERAKEELERMKMKISEEHSVKTAGMFQVTDKFTTSFDAVEEELKSSTVGLVTLEQMMEKRQILVKEREKQLAAMLPGKGNKGKGKGKGKKSGVGTLSFNMNDGDDEEEEEDGGDDSSEEEREPTSKKRKMGKNPNVDTSFLPDRDREKEEKLERETLRQEWVKAQEKIKTEEILITYSYWDGSGHRKHVKMRKGNTISQFLLKCLENLRKDFSELRVANVDNLMYVKEDLIIPHHCSFYDFIINKARGKSGPLFSFDVHDDVRLVGDASLEKDESHAGKVVLRGWYERNKHIFPASRWEPYDPERKWDKYTIADKKKKAA